MSDWTTEYWLLESQITDVMYSSYWNDEEEEKSKAWYILDGDFSKMENYLENTGLIEDLRTCIDILNDQFDRQLAGVGIDLAAGNLWAIPHILSCSDVRQVYALEYSKHRLFILGPAVLDHYHVPREKVILALGSFYDLKVEDESLDFILMSQAFHHANDPIRLLEELCRVLKPNGTIIIIGEHIIHYYRILARHILKVILSRVVPKNTQTRIFGKVLTKPKLIIPFKTLVPPDPVLGDHCYSDAKYWTLFSRYGFRVRCVRNRSSQFQSFVLVR